MLEQPAASSIPKKEIPDRREPLSFLAESIAPALSQAPSAPPDAATKRHIFRLFAALRFLLIVLVVYVHNAPLNIQYNGFSISADGSFFLRDYIIGMVSHGGGRAAVPLFNFISGYLFFLGMEWSLSAYAEKFRRRLHTLVAPFLFWNAAVFCLIAVLSALPFTAMFFNSDHASVLTFGAFQIADSILGLTHKPIAYQFWFMRDLILLVLLSPILHFLLRNACLPFILMLCAFWLSDAWPLPYPSIRSILFFVIGGAFSLRGIKPVFPNPKSVFMIFGALGFCTFTTSTLYFSKLPDFDPAQGDIFFKIGLVASLISMVALGDIIARSTGFISTSLNQLQRASFFVFATHEPLLTIVRKLAFRVLPMSPVLSLVYYLLIPPFIITVTTTLYFALERNFPKFTSFVTGGRTGEHRREPELMIRRVPITKQSAS